MKCCDTHPLLPLPSKLFNGETVRPRYRFHLGREALKGYRIEVEP